MRIRKWIYAALLLIGFAALMPGFLRSQQGVAPGMETAAASNEDDAAFEEALPTVRFVAEVSMVSVPVTVRNADGSFFRGLTQKSFRIFEDGKEQEIVFFAEEALSAHIAVVLDISGSVYPEWGTIKNSTKRFLDNFRPDDNFSLITFNTEFRMMIPWGKRFDLVDSKLSSVYCKDNTNLWDAIYLVSTDAFDGIDGKKVMIIMTDGMDNQSVYSYAEAVRAAVENGIAIYIVSKTEALRQYYEYRYPNVPQVDIQMELAQGEFMLRRLAHDTGGRVLKPNSFGQLDDIYADVSDELRNQYTLGYYSTNKAKDGSYREIDVRVTRDARNATATARPGYYAPKK
jgi:Ca-activated chloride channel family protein